MSLVLQDVRKSYREPGGRTIPILNIADFRMHDGEQVVLLGSSGGGKTTLLNVIAGITSADSGRVLIGGIDVCKLPEAARDRFRADRIGYVFQTFQLLPAFTALENILLGMTFSGKGANRSKAIQLLERVGLAHRMNHRPGQMSVGEQQRVAVARALSNTPVLLLADEPTANVDAANQQMVLDLLRDSCREEKVALLLVTHAPEVAKQFDRIERLADFNQPAALAATTGASA